MIKFQSHPGLASTVLRSLFGESSISGGTPGVSAVRANAWLPRPISIYEINHIRQAATGVGNSFVLNTYDGTSVVAAFTFGNADGTQKTTVYGPAALSAALSSAISEAHLQEHVLTGAASADGSFAIVYQDESNNALSYHNAGDGTSNISVGATTEFMSVYGGGTAGSTVEAASQCAWPTTGELSNFAVRYTTGAATSYNCLVRINGSTVLTIPLPAATSGALVIDTTAVPISVNDRVCFAFTRTAGADTLLQAVIVFTSEGT